MKFSEYGDQLLHNRLNSKHAETIDSLFAQVKTLTAERDQLQRNINADLQGNLKIREILGARDNETMFGFAERFAKERDALKADAESWRAYKARKDAVIAAGMRRNPLRKGTP